MTNYARYITTLSTDELEHEVARKVYDDEIRSAFGQTDHEADEKRAALFVECSRRDPSPWQTGRARGLAGC